MFNEMVAGGSDASDEDGGFDFQEFFEAGLDALVDIFMMVNSSMRDDISNALQKRFVVDTALVEDDLETRVGELLANVSKEIFQLAAEMNCSRFEASRIYFEELCHQEESPHKRTDNIFDD